MQTEKTPEALGEELAFLLHWRGDEIFRAFMAALTDANFHTAAAALKKTWKELEGNQNGLD